MISFYKDEAGIVMYKDDKYSDAMLFVIERRATDDDVAAHPDEQVAFVASTTVAPAPAEPVPPDSSPTPAGEQ